jgi:hypothetical protein
MKIDPRRLGRSAAALLASALCAGAFAQTPPAGMVKRVSGAVTLERGGALLPVSAGMAVLSGDRIVTGTPGTVGIVLADDTLLTAGADSRIVLDDVKFDTTTHEGNVFVRLMKGALHMVTGLIARQTPQNVKIETPTAVMGVRGTEFIVSTRGEQ